MARWTRSRIPYARGEPGPDRTPGLPTGDHTVDAPTKRCRDKRSAWNEKDTNCSADRGALYPEPVESVVKTPPGYCSTLKKDVPSRTMVPRIKQASLFVRKSNVTYDFSLSLYPTETFLGVSACRLLPEPRFKITPKLLIWAFAQPVVYTIRNNM